MGSRRPARRHDESYAPELGGQEITIDGATVRERLDAILQDQDLSRFIL